MDTKAFILIWFVVLAGLWYAAFLHVRNWLVIDGIRDPVRMARIVGILATICETIILVPVVVAFVLMNVYFFSEESRPSIDTGLETVGCAIDRGLYSITNDNPSGPFSDEYSSVPRCESNYDLVILDEVCRMSTPMTTPNDPTRIREYCGFEISPRGMETYFARESRNPEFFKYSVMQARALYNGQPLPHDPSWENE